jgi:hypothetical protein
MNYRTVQQWMAPMLASSHRPANLYRCRRTRSDSQVILHTQCAAAQHQAHTPGCCCCSHSVPVSMQHTPQLHTDSSQPEPSLPALVYAVVLLAAARQLVVDKEWSPVVISTCKESAHTASARIKTVTLREWPGTNTSGLCPAFCVRASTSRTNMA